MNEDTYNQNIHYSYTRSHASEVTKIALEIAAKIASVNRPSEDLNFQLLLRGIVIINHKLNLLGWWRPTQFVRKCHLSSI